MTPSMHLSALILQFSGHPEKEQIAAAIHQAYDIGHEFGLDRAASEVDRCNREGPYNAIGAASLIRKLRVRTPQSVAVISSDFGEDIADA